jgi:L-threonylcarbamoyladenylate synthase
VAADDPIRVPVPSPSSAPAAAIEAACRRLEAGELVAFPTETVYGLGGDARNPEAIERIFALKGRPRNHPVIVHLADGADLDCWARDLPALARDLIAAFWPGPLTLVVRRAEGVLDAVTGGQESVGLRCPAHPVAQALLAAFATRDAQSGIAAPSANRFGRVSPTTAQHVRDEFGEGLLVLDGGPSWVGIESTILDVSRLEPAGPVLLRPGAIRAEQLAPFLGRLPAAADAAAPRASGTLLAHYAPRARLRLVEATTLHEAPPDAGVWSYSMPEPASKDERSGARPIWRAAPGEAQAYAQALYAMLRWFDEEGVAEIWLEAPPDTPAWVAVHDRLARAVAGAAPAAA